MSINFKNENCRGKKNNSNLKIKQFIFEDARIIERGREKCCF